MMFQVPVLTRNRVRLAYTVAITADALQFLLLPLSWTFVEQVIDVVAMIFTWRLIGFHPLLLPTFVGEFLPVVWKGERRLTLPALGGELRFRRARGKGIDARWVEAGEMQVKLRSGGERLQPDARRPRRTLKNLFQEAGVPPWERERLPLLYRGDELVWAPGLGVDARYLAAPKRAGWVPEWRLTC